MIHDMIGGGVAFNFKVVCNPKPENPKKNTIWVDTDTPITGWAFSKSEPEKVDGCMWFLTGDSSTAAFNALKKNTLMVYPLSAKQCINGEWANKTAQIYNGEQWVGFALYLYNKGVEFIDDFGEGWKLVSPYTKHETYIRVGAAGGSAFDGYAESCYVDMTGLNTVDVHVVNYHNNGSECYSYISIIDESGATVVKQDIQKGSGSGSNIVVSVNVSAVTSKCKVRVTAGHSRTGSGREAYVDFDIVKCY